MEYTVQQQEALSLMRDFIEDDKSIFILSGYAGTGKTTLISPLLDMISTTGKYCLLMAPTGRAAKILSSKTQKEASTIHKCIYDYSNLHVCGSENEESSVKYLFPLGQIINSFGPGCPMSPKDVIIIVDEASMVSSRESSDEMFIFGSGVLLDDLINFSRLNDGGKIIFIGDPAQLPPVTDNLSCALSQDFFRDKGISVSAYELNEIVRQIDGSVILSNSIKIRDHIFHASDEPLELKRKAGETEDIKYEEMAAKYCSINPVPSMNSSVIICYTNAAAAAYNKAVREIYYPGHTEALNIGDTLMIASNNYSNDDCVLFNGTFAAVQECGKDIETQYGFVYIDDDGNREGKKKCIRIELKFTDATLMLNDGNIVSAKLLVSLLDNDKPNLTYYEHCALISNFCLRNRQLTPNTYVFNEALRHDPYYNAIRAKFGYAITCHKAQGGEWDTTFVDFTGRNGLNKDSLRWSYTAVTRARRMMYAYALSNIRRYKVKVTDILKTNNCPDEFYPDGHEIPVGPFHSSDTPAPLKAKYWHIRECLDGSGFSIATIEHKPYREIYIITNLDNEKFRLDFIFNGAGLFSGPTVSPGSMVPKELISLVSVLDNFRFPFKYVPSSEPLNRLYENICSACEDSQVNMVNVVEHLESYKVVYYLKTQARFAYLEICVKKSGQVTYISPRSELGQNDDRLAEMLALIKL